MEDVAPPHGEDDMADAAPPCSEEDMLPAPGGAEDDGAGSAAAAQLQQARAAVVASLAAFPAARSPLAWPQLARVVAALLRQLRGAAQPPDGAAETDVQAAVRGLSSLAGAFLDARRMQYGFVVSCTLPEPGHSP